jgi:hypothetical protein
MAGEQPPQGLGVDPSSPERGVEAARSAAMRRLEAQVNRGRDGSVSGEDGVGEFEEGVGPGVEAVVEAVTEGLESVVVRFHNAPIMRSARILRILCR